MSKLFLIAFLFSTLLVVSQVDHKKTKAESTKVEEIALIASSGKDGVEDNKLYDSVEVQPEFPGGMAEQHLFFAKNMRYTAEMSQKKLKGKIYSTFVVEKDGSITDIKVIRGLGYGSELQALQVLQMMPKWRVGLQSGIKVRCVHSLAIDFDANAK